MINISKIDKYKKSFSQLFYEIGQIKMLTLSFCCNNYDLFLLQLFLNIGFVNDHLFIFELILFYFLSPTLSKSLSQQFHIAQLSHMHKAL